MVRDVEEICANNTDYRMKWGPSGSSAAMIWFKLSKLLLCYGQSLMLWPCLKHAESKDAAIL